MMEEFASFLSEVFPVHMFFSVQLLIAEMLFVVGQKKRSRPLLRFALAIPLYLIVCWFHPSVGHKMIRVLCIFAESYLLLLFCLNISAKGCLFVAIGAYAVQNLAFYHFLVLEVDYRMDILVDTGFKGLDVIFIVAVVFFLLSIAAGIVGSCMKQEKE